MAFGGVLSRAQSRSRARQQSGSALQDEPAAAAKKRRKAESTKARQPSKLATAPTVGRKKTRGPGGFK